MTEVAAMTYDHKASLAVIDLLSEAFPACFHVYEDRRRPLKIGVHNDILAALDGVVTPAELSNALRLYCSNKKYLQACTEGAPRIDLTGEVAGSVTAEEAAGSKASLAALQARRKRQLEAKKQEKAKAEAAARNRGRVSLADLRKAAEKRRAVAA